MPPTRSIAIETSSRRGSVGLGEDDRWIVETDFAADVCHAAELLPAMAAMCRKVGWQVQTIGHVYVSIGPGSFTGLRVAATTARHLALALGARVVAVPSLQVIADGVCRLSLAPVHLAVVLDAKRKQVYAGAFELTAGWYEPVADPVVAEPGPWLTSLPRPLAVTGEGIAFHRTAIEAADATLLDASIGWPRAESVHRLGWRLAHQGRFTPPRELIPLYLRRPEAEEVWERRAQSERPPDSRSQTNPGEEGSSRSNAHE